MSIFLEAKEGEGDSDDDRWSPFTSRDYEYAVTSDGHSALLASMQW